MFDLFETELEYWSFGIRMAKSNSAAISRWEYQFEHDIFCNAKKVLKGKISEFIPDIRDIEEILTESQLIDQKLFDEWNLDDEPYYY